MLVLYPIYMSYPDVARAEILNLIPSIVYITPAWILVAVLDQLLLTCLKEESSTNLLVLIMIILLRQKHASA